MSLPEPKTLPVIVDPGANVSVLPTMATANLRSPLIVPELNKNDAVELLDTISLAPLDTVTLVAIILPEFIILKLKANISPVIVPELTIVRSVRPPIEPSIFPVLLIVPPLDAKIAPGTAPLTLTGPATIVPELL